MLAHHSVPLCACLQHDIIVALVFCQYRFLNERDGLTVELCASMYDLVWKQEAYPPLVAMLHRSSVFPVLDSPTNYTF